MYRWTLRSAKDQRGAAGDVTQYAATGNILRQSVDSEGEC
jgi:hypothetical protein